MQINCKVDLSEKQFHITFSSVFQSVKSILIPTPAPELIPGESEFEERRLQIASLGEDPAAVAYTDKPTRPRFSLMRGVTIGADKGVPTVADVSCFANHKIGTVRRQFAARRLHPAQYTCDPLLLQSGRLEGYQCDRSNVNADLWLRKNCYDEATRKENQADIAAALITRPASSLSQDLYFIHKTVARGSRPQRLAIVQARADQLGLARTGDQHRLQIQSLKQKRKLQFVFSSEEIAWKKEREAGRLTKPVVSV